MVTQERDYIGPDPVRWVERLLEVNQLSLFTSEERTIISVALNKLLGDLAINRDVRM